MILITGGTGFIGQCVCSILSAHGKDIVALDLNGPDVRVARPPYRFVKGDLWDQRLIEGVFADYSFTAVIHLAGLLNTASRESPETATQVNIMGTVNLLEAMRKSKVRKLIYGSSISVYGSQFEKQQRDTTEADLAAPDDIYGGSKRYVEILGESYRRQFGIDFVAFRISTVVGPGATKTASPWRSELFERIGSRGNSEVGDPFGKH